MGAAVGALDLENVPSRRVPTSPGRHPLTVAMVRMDGTRTGHKRLSQSVRQRLLLTAGMSYSTLGLQILAPLASTHGHHVCWLTWFAISRPSIHEVSALIQRIATAVSLFRLVADDVS